MINKTRYQAMVYRVCMDLRLQAMLAGGKSEWKWNHWFGKSTGDYLVEALMAVEDEILSFEDGSNEVGN